MLAKSSQTLNVGLLLESIAQTAEFERETARKFSLSVSVAYSLCISLSDSSLAVRGHSQAFAAQLRRTRRNSTDLERL